MKKIAGWLIALSVIAASADALAAGSRKNDVAPWKTTEINSINRMKMSSSFDTDGINLSLNGMWDFRFYADPALKSADFFRADYDASSWDRIPVPGLWDVNGYCDPLYVNIPYPWYGHFPYTPPIVPDEHNYVGQYRRHFSLDESWKGQEVILHIGSATSNVRVWVNGREAGYSEDSKLEARFDISGLVHQGDNLIALEIHRWCDGTYLECQDFWRLAGISRDVFLLSRPRQHIDDIRVNASADGDYRIVAETSAGVSRLKWRIFDPKGVLKESGETVVNSRKKSADGASHITEISGVVRLPRQWTAETPYLYRLEIDAVTSRGARTQTASLDFGFRTVEIRDGLLVVNDRPIIVKGVNRHEMNAYKGYLVSEADMMEDIRIMKQLNFNAVRCCHYPDDPLWYRLCDRYGLYVVDEADNEGHGMGYDGESLAKNPIYASTILERVQRMAQRDCNHPSVIVWSLGNETGFGQNFRDAYTWLKEFDSSRPVQYERAVYDEVNHGRMDPDGKYTDIMCPMYWDYATCENYVRNHPSRPLIQCEYAHAMGNSMGGFKEYWDLVRKYPGYQGGFIWDFVDQALRWPADASKYGTDHIFAFGGDFNDYDPSDCSFNCNGVIASDRSLHPHAYEVAYQQRSIHTSATPSDAISGKVQVYNEYSFIYLRRFALNWTIECDGVPVLQGTAPDILEIAPGETRTVNLGYGADAVAKYCGGDRDVYLNLRYTLRRADGLLPAGTEISYDQICLASAEVKAYRPEVRPYVLSEDGESVTVCGNALYRGTLSPRAAEWKAVFDRQSGLLTGYFLNGAALLSSPLRPCFFRAATENDLGANYKDRKLVDAQQIWRDARFRPVSFGVEDKGEYVQIAVEFAPLQNAAVTSLLYRVYGDGSLAVTESLGDAGELSEAAIMPRFGMQFSMPGEYSDIEFYGKGPFENYSDRNSAALVGLYRQRVENQYHFGYVRPQESGTKTGLRWFRVLDGNGTGFEISSDVLFSASALPFSAGQLDLRKSGLRHSLELKSLACENHRSDGETWVNFDLVQMGLGCIDSWGALPREEYRITPREMSFSYILRPVNN